MHTPRTHDNDNDNRGVLSKLVTRASSINRALDEIGDKWCLLILQEGFWGVSAFNELMHATGASRGVLSNRLKWLQSVGCLSRERGAAGQVRYHLTDKSLDLYQCALMALQWERHHGRDRGAEDVVLRHRGCGSEFIPRVRCGACDGEIGVWDVDYAPGPGATHDEREKKTRRRSSVPLGRVPGRRHYLGLINIVGDRWTANLIALCFHGLTRFEQFHRELPVATNILADRLRLLLAQDILVREPYQARPPRHDYRLSARGEALFPWFLTLLHWGDRWCDPGAAGPPLRLTHRSCGEPLVAQVKCGACGEVLRAREVEFRASPAQR